jgi:hypothetical protein
MIERPFLSFAPEIRVEVPWQGVLKEAAVGDLIDVQSAGSRPAGYVHPNAIEVMKEIGIDISGHTSKHMSEYHAAAHVAVPSKATTFLAGLRPKR